MNIPVLAACVLLSAGAPILEAHPCVPPLPGPSYRVLQSEVERVNRIFTPFARRIDRWLERAGRGEPVPEDWVQQLLKLDERVQHVNAEVMLKDRPPEKVQRELERVWLDLCDLRRKNWCVVRQKRLSNPCRQGIQSP